jgi:hypothetical protein
MRRRVALLVLGMLTAASTLPGQPVTARVDGAVVRQYVATLASPDMQGRRTLTPGYDRAADWAAARLREWGLKPAGDAGTFFQAVPVTGPRSDFAWTTGVPAVAVGGRAYSFKEGDFAVDPSSTPAIDVTAEAVFAGYGISAPAKGLDEYAGLDVAGKIVVVFRGSPRDAPPDTTDFPPDPPAVARADEAWAGESTDAAKALTAYQKGAAAILICDIAPASSGSPVRRRVERSPFTRPFLVISVTDPHLWRAVLLRDSQESVVGFNDRVGRMQRAIKNGAPQSSATGVQVRARGFDTVTLYGESFGRNESRNVLAKVEGSDPSLRNEYVVVGAHLDHLGIRTGLLHLGADDNASGSAVVLEVARLFAVSELKPRRTVVFALWCGEENGHHGSRRWTASPSDGASIDRVVAYINMDMVGLGTGVDAMGAKDFPSIFTVMMRDQLAEVARAVRPDVSGPGGSDYAAFLERGVETVALFSSGGGGHPDYHDSGDVVEKIAPGLLGTVGQFVLQATFNLATDTRAGLPSADRRAVCDSLKFAVPDVAGGSAGPWRVVPAASPRDLGGLVAGDVTRMREARGAAPSPVVSPLVRLRTGVAGAALGGSVPLLETARAALDVGRVDLAGDDGIWTRGGLTEAGKTALKAMEAAGITVNLVRPSTKLLDEVLSAATRPFMVSGLADVDEALAARLKSRDAAVVFECQAADPAACAAGLERLRSRFGGSGNLIVSMRGAADRAPASRRLYLTLAKEGWSKAAIYAVAGTTPAGDPGGNLARFGEK